MCNWKRKYIQMVAVEVGVVRQYGAVAIAASLDTIRAFIRRTKKCPMYIVPIDFNWFLMLWWINGGKKVYSVKKCPARYAVQLAIHLRYNLLYMNIHIDKAEINSWDTLLYSVLFFKSMIIWSGTSCRYGRRCEQVSSSCLQNAV